MKYIAALCLLCFASVATADVVVTFPPRAVRTYSTYAAPVQSYSYAAPATVVYSAPAYSSSYSVVEGQTASQRAHERKAKRKSRQAERHAQKA